MAGINNILGKDINIGFGKLSKSNNILLEKFNCDNPSIDKYFTEDALNDRQSTTYLFINKDEEDIVAAFTIYCSGVIDRSNPANRNILSAIEICYFATNKKYQKLPYSENKNDRTLSHQLICFCINYIREVPCSYCAASILILYSVPDAVKFYSNAGFDNFTVKISLI